MVPSEQLEPETLQMGLIDARELLRYHKQCTGVADMYILLRIYRDMLPCCNSPLPESNVRDALDFAVKEYLKSYI